MPGCLKLALSDVVSHGVPPLSYRLFFVFFLLLLWQVEKASGKNVDVTGFPTDEDIIIKK